MNLTDKQLSALQTAERVASSLSLLGCAFIVTTYCSSPVFRKPIGRLIFYASFGNILSSFATLVSREALHDGQDSVLCQLQAFFIQQWMPADSLWSLCMALNIYLVFYKRYSAAQLKSLEWRYFLVCYGLPLIPSVTLMCINTRGRGRIYGPALIWCSIDNRWRYLRLACFYGPVWLIIVATFTIYVIVGRDIFRTRRALRSCLEPPVDTFTNSDEHQDSRTRMDELSNDIERPGRLHLSESNSSNVPIRPKSPSIPQSTHMESSKQHQRPRKTAAELNTDAVAWSYLRCSFLFFIALVVTWLPSSINRVYAVIHPEDQNFGLNFVGSFVLPLQGLWNGIIYLSTSFSACKNLWLTHVVSKLRQKRALDRRTIPLYEEGYNERAETGSTVPLAPVCT